MRQRLILNGYNACKFSGQKTLHTNRLNQDVVKLDIINNKLKDLYNNLKEIEEADDDITDKNIKYYVRYLDLVNNLEKRKYVNIEKDLVEILLNKLIHNMNNCIIKQTFFRKISKLDNKSKYLP